MNAIDPAHIERIEAFIHAGNDPAARAAFQTELDNDPALAASYVAYCDLEAALREQNTTKLRTTLAQLEQKLPPVALEAKNLRLRRTIAFAVAACVAFVVGFFWGMDDHRNEAIALWEPEPGLPVLMNSGSTWNPIMNAYKQARYDEAQQLLAPLRSDTAMYFKGVIAFEREAYADAALAFGQIDKKSTWYSEAVVREIIALIAADRIAEARVALDEAAASHQLTSEKLEVLRAIVD